MHDPVGAFTDLRDHYIAYLDTAFRIDDRELAEERRRLLRSPGELATDPYLELVPRYGPALDVDGAPITLERLIEDDDPTNPLDSLVPETRRAFVQVVLAGLFEPVRSEVGAAMTDEEGERRSSFPPYAHQLEMLRLGLGEGTPGIVTSGTGSGKTESFLLPILARIVAEAVSWGTPDDGYLRRPWWRDDEGRPYGRVKNGQVRHRWGDLPAERRVGKNHPTATPHSDVRAGESPARPRAVRALVIYPMNALVEDQLVRLRKALDSADAREVMDQHLNGNRIFFGRYTSKTPVTGHRVHPGLASLDRVADDDALSDFVGRQSRRQQQLLDAMLELELTQKQVRLRALQRRNLRRLAVRLRTESEPDLPTLVASTGHLDFEALQALLDRHGVRDDDMRPALEAIAPAPHEPPPADSDDEEAFDFQSIDGAELTSRWDMQVAPPDILITNVSMLSAMLNREVEDPIFDLTREWLLENDDAYFHLVLDELHLHRGSGGTEVSYLLRLLVHRLGLDHPDHRHKLKILASSASLPTDGDRGAESRNYLEEMFGSLGLQGDDWLDHVVSGHPVPWSPPGVAPPLSPDPFEALATRLEEVDAGDGSAAWADQQVDLLDDPVLIQAVEHLTGGRHDLAAATREAGLHLAAAGPAAAGRAVALAEVAGELFGADSPRALRGLAAVRGLGDRCSISEAPSFRLHTFFRSPEGLFAPVDPRRPSGVGELSLAGGTDAVIDGSSRRQFELLYCEACGETLFGGNTPAAQPARGVITELMPHQTEIEQLPDASGSTDFEGQSAATFGVFWHSAPTGTSPETRNQRGVPGWNWEWIPALLDGGSGVVLNWDGHSAPQPGQLSGYFLHFSGDGGHRTDAGSHVPHVCPRCGTDYGPRPAKYRQSSIRNFRAGFGKTTQLFATETFAIGPRQGSGVRSKLISFSDSRQDAARAALSIESLHHQDLRRQVLYGAAIRELTSARERLAELEAQAQDLTARLGSTSAASDPDYRVNLEDRLASVTRDIAAAQRGVVSVQTLIGDADRPGPLVTEVARTGTNPFDEVARRRVPVGQGADVRRIDWTELLSLRGEEVIWKERTPLTVEDTRRARAEILARTLEVSTDVLFSKTYYAIEETGLAYVGLAPTDVNELDPAEQQRAAAVIRILADAYRYDPSPFHRDTNDWTSIQNRTQLAEVASFRRLGKRGLDLEDLIPDLERLDGAGHRGFLDVRRLALYLVDDDATSLRCRNCSRVHLHRGIGVCTRCAVRFDQGSEVDVSEVRRGFLTRRAIRSGADPVFRLHAEELTGQTHDPGSRQQSFRGVQVPDVQHNGEVDDDTNGWSGDILDFTTRDRDPLVSRRDEIDLLTVTTTMEVGIDIGSLSSILQANMPPQRFNYQQRVGRAGRRGQAFSLAVTICRSKSHDLHYFNDPASITGDPPPVPFLTKRLPQIARRIAWKGTLRWLFAAYRRRVRASAPLPFPADFGAAPDIHGEFLPASFLVDDGFAYWRDDFTEWLTSDPTAVDALAAGERLVEFLHADDNAEVRRAQAPTRGELLAHFGAAAGVGPEGLGEALAELGYLPMYGMPTRVRSLYYDLDSRGGREEWMTIDRDLDIAIYEFAPGASVVVDKRLHSSVGLTPPLLPPFHRRPGEDFRRVPLGRKGERPYITEEFEVTQCPVCYAWERLDGTDEDKNCGGCESTLPTSGSGVHHVVVPAAFRTDFLPTDEEESSGGRRHRSVQAEGAALDDWRTEGLGDGRQLRLQRSSEARTFRVNRGPTWDDGTGFRMTVGTTDVPRRSRPRLEHQAVDPENDQVPVTPTGGGLPLAWLGAPKTTSSLFVSVAEGSRRNPLAWSRLVPAQRDSEIIQSRELAPSRAKSWAGLRAAAISATSALASACADLLDVDPEEFDQIEPRLYGAERTLVLQITDELINGSGLCEYLTSVGADGTSPLTALMRRLLDDDDSFPRADWTSAHHANRCRSSCYDCMRRYGNQASHALLDWRLALQLLRAMVDPRYSCGLLDDHGNGLVEDQSWLMSAHEATRAMASTFRMESIAVGGRGMAPLPAFRLGPNRGPWVVVRHPIWDTEDGAVGWLAEAEDELIFDHSADQPVLFVDSFNVARRPGEVRGWLLQQR